jgi:hypothetical protein
MLSHHQSHLHMTTARAAKSSAGQGTTTSVKLSAPLVSQVLWSSSEALYAAHSLAQALLAAAAAYVGMTATVTDCLITSRAP